MFNRPRKGDLKEQPAKYSHELEISSRVKEILTQEDSFMDFLNIREVYKLKGVARNCSNHYHDSKEI